jgi:hypothetical protein
MAFCSSASLHASCSNSWAYWLLRVILHELSVLERERARYLPCLGGALSCGVFGQASTWQAGSGVPMAILLLAARANSHKDPVHMCDEGCAAQLRCCWHLSGLVLAAATLGPPFRPFAVFHRLQKNREYGFTPP